MNEKLLTDLITSELLARYDKPGPRYTSYPTALEFHTGVDDSVYEDLQLDVPTPDTLPQEDIRRRLVLVMINEAATMPYPTNRGRGEGI